MKLQEAFIERNEIRKKMKRLQEDILNGVVQQVQSSVGPLTPSAHEVLEKKQLQYLELADKLETLNCQIDKTNQANVTELNELRLLIEKISHIGKIREKIVEWKPLMPASRFSEALLETRIVYFNAEDVTSQLEELEKRKRRVEALLAQKNWTLDLQD